MPRPPYEKQLMISKSKFTIWGLVLFTTLAAVFVKLSLLMGPLAIFLIAIPLVTTVGILSSNAGSPAPFWMCLTSLAILPFLAPPVGRHEGPNDCQVVLFSVLVSVGSFLSYSALRYGHWSTLVRAVLVAIPYALIFAEIVSWAKNNYDSLSNYWLR